MYIFHLQKSIQWYSLLYVALHDLDWDGCCNSCFATVPFCKSGPMIVFFSRCTGSALFNACSKSAMISLICSIPTEICTHKHLNQDLRVNLITYPNQIWCDPGGKPLCFRQLLMRSRRWMDHKSFCITDVCKITCKTKTIYESAGVLDVALNTESQHTAESVRP